MGGAEVAGWLTAIGTGIGGLVTAIVTRRKVTAETESVSITTMQKVVESVRTEMSRLQDANENLRLRVGELEHTNQQLVFRLVKLETYISKTGVDPKKINGH